MSSDVVRRPGNEQLLARQRSSIEMSPMNSGGMYTDSKAIAKSALPGDIAEAADTSALLHRSESIDTNDTLPDNGIVEYRVCKYKEGCKHHSVWGNLLITPFVLRQGPLLRSGTAGPPEHHR